jgi:hypothetical protein
MKTFTKSILVSLFLMIGAPAYSDSGMQAIQIYDCEFNDDATADQVLAVSADWLKAARNSKGGKNLQLAIRFPIAEGEAGDGDFRFVIVLPSFTEWGEFTDAYEGSEVAKVDERLQELADCGYSTMWEGIFVK